MNKKLNDLILSKDFISLTLSNKRNKSQLEKKIELRPIITDNERTYQFSCYIENKVIHINASKDEVVNKVISFLEDKFKQINVFTIDEDVQILANKVENPKFISSPPSKSSKQISLNHNRVKNHIIPEGKPCDFLIYLGVMSKDGKVIKKHYNKFKQINRFLEILKDSLDEASHILEKDDNKLIKIIDFGCGKAYLTFAIYYYLVKILNKPVQIIGLDLKNDVIKFCEETARYLNYDGLSFKVGDIATFENKDCDIVVSLHACDTATDYGLINAVSWNSKIILSVPCCQHELFKQIDETTLNPILKHGINKDKFTEILTNGLRALKLESRGYKVSMAEFTSLEHTAKNVVIRAVKTNKSKVSMSKALKEYEEIKKLYNINPTIDKL